MLNITILLYITVFVDREGTSAEADLLVRDGNASLVMQRLKVTDEGTYICTVGSGEFQTQQIVQLQITRESFIEWSQKMSQRFPDILWRCCVWIVSATKKKVFSQNCEI